MKVIDTTRLFCSSPIKAKKLIALYWLWMENENKKASKEIEKKIKKLRKNLEKEIKKLRKQGEK